MQVFASREENEQNSWRHRRKSRDVKLISPFAAKKECIQECFHWQLIATVNKKYTHFVPTSIITQGKLFDIDIRNQINIFTILEERLKDYKCWITSLENKSAEFYLQVPYGKPKIYLNAKCRKIKFINRFSDNDVAYKKYDIRMLLTYNASSSFYSHVIAIIQSHSTYKCDEAA